MINLLADAIKFDDLIKEIPGLRPEYMPVGGKTSVVVGGVLSGIILPYLFVIAGLILLFMLIMGGIGMMLGANNENGLKKAQGQITNALLGFLMLFISYWIVQIVEAVLGITIF